ncbi:UNVERIFIED_CONTAM: hypothetical protein NCL1_53865 [Trichonephila clavipes]
MEAGWTARQVARQSDRSDCVVRRCWDQWIREMSFTRRPGSGRPRQTCRRADNHIVRNARVQLTASSSVIQVQVAPSRRGPVSSRTIQRRLAEGYLNILYNNFIRNYDAERGESSRRFLWKIGEWGEAHKRRTHHMMCSITNTTTVAS